MEPNSERNFLICFDALVLQYLIASAKGGNTALLAYFHILKK
jgi:hypothetical protein